MVLQDTWLFHGTIRENIAYGREDATEEQIVAAAEEAHVDHFVRTLPDGYDTVVDDDATNLSQGEKQLLTIARAFLADPRMLILDEATSSVDTRTEVLIQRAMAKLMAGRTTFVIAHRLSTIRDADLIVVMDHGKIVETGTHQQLLAAGASTTSCTRASSWRHSPKRPLPRPFRSPGRGDAWPWPARALGNSFPHLVRLLGVISPHPPTHHGKIGQLPRAVRESTALEVVEPECEAEGIEIGVECRTVADSRGSALALEHPAT